jgi:hypothetical protein
LSLRQAVEGVERVDETGGQGGELGLLLGPGVLSNVLDRRQECGAQSFQVGPSTLRAVLGLL